MADYVANRARLIETFPGMEHLLPIEEPAPVPVPRLTERQRVALLRPAANNHCSQVIVYGWGDGTIARSLLGDPLCRQKNLLVVVFGGEEGAFARAITELEETAWNGGNIRISLIVCEADLHRLIISNFNHHEQLPMLAGVEVIDGHPLTAAAEETRSRLGQRLTTLLSDRPQAYGNDIVDSFTGLDNSAANARTLLPAPTIGEMTGFFGTTPIIAIGAGPSLRRHVDTLRRLQDRCILVACDAVLHGLLDAGIDPHFITPLERVDAILPMLTRAGSSRAIYAGLPVCPREAINHFGPDRAISLYCGDRLYDWLCPEPGNRVNTGLSTGTLSVSVACALGTGSVYLVGHDLAKDANASHWDGAAYALNDWAKAKVSVDRERPALSGYEDRLIPGNDGGMVASIAWWDRFRFDITHEAEAMQRAGRTLYNVNAHDRIFARIDHTGSAPLPDPESLPVLAPWRLPARNQGRYDAWAARARQLPADGLAFVKHFEKLREDLAATMRQGPSAWQAETFAERLDLTSAVSTGNRAAFAYMLRSALHNSNADMHLHRRTESSARSRWIMLQSMDDLSQALIIAMTTLQPELERIAHEHS
jgi:hypothetical protein